MLRKLCLFLSCLIVSSESSLIVNTSSGSIQGFTASSTNGNPFNAFLAIPYAKPPVGELRFKEPEPFEVGVWEGVRDGTQVGPQCPQINFATNGTQGDEDCLYLNVYVPESVSPDPLPVLFYIHGGGFMYGSGRFIEYGPQNYMDYPIILVIPNWRFGVLGFLSTNDSNAYGNYGMMDQHLALNWVQENIGNFGGDSTRVTIFGDSSGTGSVVHQVISELSQGLFIGAIAESGSATSHWAVQADPLYFAQKLGSALDCEWNDNSELVQCLREQNASDIVLAAYQFQTSAYFPINWAPVVEAPGGPGFLTDYPVNLLQQNKIGNRVPMIIGHNDLEGWTLYSDLKSSFKYNGSEYFKKQFPSQLPLFTIVQPYMTDAVDAIINEYCNNCDLDNETVFSYVLSEIIGDAMMATATAQTADLMSADGLPVFAYIYSYVAQHCLAESFGAPCGQFASHGDEVLLQFRYMGFTQPMSPNDTLMSQIWDSTWVNFAYQNDLFINENQKWPLYNVSNPFHVVFNLNSSITAGTLSNQTLFWTQKIPSIVKNYLKLSH